MLPYSRSGEMDDLTNFDGDIYRPAIGSSDESLSNFKVLVDYIFIDVM